MRRRMGLFTLCIAGLLTWGVGSACAPRPKAVASAPVRLAERLPDVPGLQNLGRLSPALYRGAMPDEAGLDRLKAMGIRTVINLRHYHGHSEEKACRDRGLDYAWVQLESSDAPEDADVRRFLALVTDPARQPVYVHCLHGKDRTGTMCACYRMAVDGWELGEALGEMDAFGFRPMWRDLRRFVEGFPSRLGEFKPTSP